MGALCRDEHAVNHQSINQSSKQVISQRYICMAQILIFTVTSISIGEKQKNGQNLTTSLKKNRHKDDYQRSTTEIKTQERLKMNTF